MKSNKSAVRYAKALLELAIEHNKVELIESDIQQLLTVANDAHDFQIFLNSPLINIDKKNRGDQRDFQRFQSNHA